MSCHDSAMVYCGSVPVRLTDISTGDLLAYLNRRVFDPANVLSCAIHERMAQHLADRGELWDMTGGTLGESFVHWLAGRHILQRRNGAPDVYPDPLYGPMDPDDFKGQQEGQDR